ncbi:PTS system transcriptional activator [Thermoanaerobacterium xylanolyticum LX-11]|uniref:PTS system transcriptional activator n=1 Tax=Thermoanaerobacterium xylanolyticum (strain ATCC 49914 / DSM 7097 / LX-11) TaxID=858215 RepID=F6BJS8_THEXL|nr:sigma 54-interacting transcriptional regulator [Thermoanaerobacterium xylanolyticum]AEF16985.1 PTS system transcriptional activator [Thermoanaerobacterium xylanolyticum LX-11]
MDEIVKIIKNEDKKNPLTDEKIASMLKINREEVTQYRLENGIPDSRERRKPYLYEDAKKILSEDKEISDRKFTKRLNDLGYDISRFAASQVKKEILSSELIVADNVKYNDDGKDDGIGRESDFMSFKEIIGHDGSLKTQISQAKAAILYPPHGLHTLILGPSGVGKSQLAEAMYEFAIESGMLKDGSPFVVFNCADYADNPQLLMSQLFGYVKGAYTGAESSKAGLVEKADGGILFLDEVHRLPSEGQEILFFLLDKGKFRRLGETDSERQANIMLIAATTENPESSLLLTFRRRIPMVIELPPLKDRPFYERYEIVRHFFSKEAFRVNRPIIVKKDVIRALMLYDCPGNIGQLRSDIQVACARGFLNSLDSKSDEIVLNLSDLPNHVRMGLLKVNKREPEIEKYLNNDMIINSDERNKMLPKEDRYILPDEIYQFIEERFNELKNQGLANDDIYKIVGRQVEMELKRFANNIKSNVVVSKRELKEIVGEKILYAVENAVKIAKQNYKNVQDNLFYSLAIHLGAAYERLKSGKTIINPQLENVKREYTNEFIVARKMVDRINKDLGIELTEDEIGFIAMYLRTFSTNVDKEKGRVGVIVLTHGHVAGGMVDVANKLLGVNIAVGIEMSLDESPENALERTIEVVKKVDEGKGCLILVDMGSLITFGEIITKRTGIQTRVIGRVDTVMVLEAVRRAIIPDATIDEIADALDENKTYVGHVEGVKDSNKLPKAIVTICITGEGTALKIKKYIEDEIPGVEKIIKIIPVGIFSKREIDEEISKIRSKNNVVAFVGTIDPKIDDIPFIPVEEIMNGIGLERLKKMTGMDIKLNSRLKDIIKEDLILYNFDATVKSDVIDEMVELLEDKGYVDDRFMLSVYKRESMGATWMKGGIAIPHGDTKYVTKPAIAIAKLKKTICWEGDLETDLIFMIALKEDSKDYMLDLYKVMTDEKIVNELKTAKDSAQIKDIILKYTIPSN